MNYEKNYNLFLESLYNIKMIMRGGKMKLDDLLKDVFKFQKEIEKLMMISTYLDGHDFENKYDFPNTAEEYLIYDNLMMAFEKLEDINNTLNYLRQPIISRGVLIKKTNGRYGFTDKNGEEYEYTCGRGIEFKYFDEFDDKYKWAISSVEFNNNYYIKHYKKIDMNNLEVRIRE